MDDAALSALIDQVAASPKVPETSKPLKSRARTATKGGKKQPKRIRSKAEGTDTSKKLLVDRTAKQIASSMGVNLSNAGTEALKGLTELFGGKGKLSSGLSFDEQTYAKAKPHFQQMMRDFDAAGRDLKDLISGDLRQQDGRKTGHRSTSRVSVLYRVRLCRLVPARAIGAGHALCAGTWRCGAGDRGQGRCQRRDDGGLDQRGLLPCRSGLRVGAEDLCA